MTTDKPKKTGKPRWWLNTYFLFGILLVVIACLGFAKGARHITDPGQPFTQALPWYYLAAALLFLINGYVSHQATIRAYRKSISEETDAKMLDLR